MPVNGWWHEWTFNYDVKVDNNEVFLDLAEREAKILVWLGEDWQPQTAEPQPQAGESQPQADESQPESSVESTPNDDTASKEVNE
jgi:hypothetical protein